MERGFTVDSDDVFPPTLDEDLWQSALAGRASEIPEGFKTSGCRSHVLLAACKEDEKAYEREGCGVFTAALFKALEEVRDLADASYEELIGNLKQITQYEATSQIPVMAVLMGSFQAVSSV